MTTETTPLKPLAADQLQEHIDFEPLQVAHRIRKFFDFANLEKDKDYFIAALPIGRGLEFFYKTEKGKLAFEALKNSIIVTNDGEVA